jgi:hypothetical protein
VKLVDCIPEELTQDDIRKVKGIVKYANLKHRSRIQEGAELEKRTNQACEQKKEESR